MSKKDPPNISDFHKHKGSATSDAEALGWLASKARNTGNNKTADALEKIREEYVKNNEDPTDPAP